MILSQTPELTVRVLEVPGGESLVCKTVSASPKRAAAVSLAAWYLNSDTSIHPAYLG
jgi:hypothetical protein